MDSFELNKMIGAFLATVFLVFTVTLLSDAIFASPPPEKEGYIIAVAEPTAGEEPAEEKGLEPIAPLLAGADVAAGEKAFRKCAACHTVDDGGANKVGPNLWNVVNGPVLHIGGFSYSAAMTEFAAGGSTVWDYENLNGFLKNPRKFVKGTSMGFAGIKKTDERANLIAYLRDQSSNPAPLPE